MLFFDCINYYDMRLNIDANCVYSANYSNCPIKLELGKGSITPLTIYALIDVGQKTAGDGYCCQNDCKLKFDHKTIKVICWPLCS